MNYIVVAGHLGKDAETRFTPDGKKVVSFSIAQRTYKAGKDDTIWYRVTSWGDRLDKMLPYLTKGAAVMVTGELGKPEMYTDKSGVQQISSLEIRAETVRFSPFGKPNQQGEHQQPQAQQYQAQAPAPAMAGGSSPAPVEEDEDQLPF